MGSFWATPDDEEINEDLEHGDHVYVEEEPYWTIEEVIQHLKLNSMFQADFKE